jgi:hypothetical protein
MGDDRFYAEGAVGKCRDDVVDLVIEPERPHQLQLARDGQGNEDRMGPGRQQSHHDHASAAYSPLDRRRQPLMAA